MTDPFLITGPAAVQCSFGRTSGYLLWRIMQAHGGKLPPDVHVMFENTGKEARATLEFGHRIEVEWGVPITWLEYERKYLPIYRSPDREAAAARAREVCGHVFEPANGRKERGFRVVTYETASRDGEPFHNLIDMHGLPNQNTRLCTAEMKIRVGKKYMMSLGYQEWDNVIGLRADEPKRVARRRAAEHDNGQRWTDVMPLATANITKREVLEFWRSQPFDLDLPVDEHGDTIGGNCDLCFLKGKKKKLALIKADPASAEWWIEQERRTGATFRPHGETYAKHHLTVIQDVPVPVCEVDDDLGDCFCHD